MRALIFILLALVCLSCSHDDDSMPASLKEQVTIHWEASSQGKHVDGSIRVDVITHDGKTYGTDSTHNDVYLYLEKGDYVTFMITTYPEDQAQNEAGIDVEYSIKSKGLLLIDHTSGTSFLMK